MEKHIKCQPSDKTETKKGWIVPVEHAERVRDREAFERQWNADFPRACRMTRLLIVSGLWKGHCCLRIPHLQLEEARETRICKELLFLSAATIAMSAASNALPS